MAETIKGINVVISGETTGLQKALSDVNQKSKNINSELRQIEKLLKLDPTNTTLLAQKQKLLSDAVATSKEKLDALKKAQEQVNQQFQRGEISEGQYRAFQREIAATEQALEKLEGQLKDTGTAAKNSSIDIQGMGDKLKGVGEGMSVGITAPLAAGFALVTQGTKELRGDLAKLSTNAEIAGQDMGILDEAMATLQAVTGETDSNVEGLSELLATGFRDEQLSELLDSLYGASIKFSDTLKFEGIADGLQETLATGAAIGPFAELLERSGIVLDDFNAGLTEAIANGTEEQYVLDVLSKTGLAQTYEAYRKNNEEMVKAEEANFRMQQAMAQLGATLEPLLTPIIDGITQLVKRFNEMDPAGQKIVLVIAGIAAAIGPALIAFGTLATSASSVIGFFKAGENGISTFGTLIKGLTSPIGIAVLAIGTLIAGGILLYKNWDTIKAKAQELWAKLGEVWDGIKKSLSDTWEEIKRSAGIIWDSIKEFFKKWGDEIILVAIGPAGWIVLLGRKLAENWESIKRTARTIWDNIKIEISNIWDSITGSINRAAGNVTSAVKTGLGEAWSYIQSIPSRAQQWGRDIIAALVDGITSIHIPMPHFDFSVSWRSIAGVDFPVPNVDVDWYAKGGIFTSPQVIGVGEAGTEAVIPLDKLEKFLGNGQPVEVILKLDSAVLSRQLVYLNQSKLRGQGL